MRRCRRSPSSAWPSPRPTWRRRRHRTAAPGTSSSSPGVDSSALTCSDDRLSAKALEFFVGHLRARSADDAGRLGKLVVALAVIERRQQLALGEVAGAAENDEVKRIDWDDLTCHVCVHSLRTRDCEHPYNLIDLNMPVPWCHMQFAHWNLTQCNVARVCQGSTRHPSFAAAT